MTKTHDGEIEVENDTEEMLDTLNRFKSTDITPHDVKDDLPQKASMMNDSQILKSGTMKLTKKRKEALKCAKRNPNLSQEEIASKSGVSKSTVSDAVRNFDFILENEKFYEAFIRNGLSAEIKKMYVVKCEHEDCTGLFSRFEDEEDARQRAENHLVSWGHFPVIEHKNGDIVDAYNPDVVMKYETSSVVEGMEKISKEFNSVPSFFASVGKNGFNMFEKESVDNNEDQDVLSEISEDELFDIFKVIMDSDDVSEETEKKIARLI